MSTDVVIVDEDQFNEALISVRSDASDVNWYSALSYFMHYCNNVYYIYMYLIC